MVSSCGMACVTPSGTAPSTAIISDAHNVWSGISSATDSVYQMFKTPPVYKPTMVYVHDASQVTH